MEDKVLMRRLRAMMCEVENEKRGMTLDEMRRLHGVRLPRWLYRLIRELLGGYHERERYLRGKSTSDEVRVEYERINRAIDDVVEVVCFGYGSDVAKTIREDMIAGHGWRSSGMSAIFGERTFYRLKKQCYLYLAAKLYLI